MTQAQTFADFFARVSIINLETRPDRRKSVLAELAALGFDPAQADIPHAPVVDDANGFPSRGVYGNFLSHLGILKAARDADLPGPVLVLEDDAIFSRAARGRRFQARTIAEAESHDWGMWFLGHKLRRELAGAPRGVIPSTLPFHWAHCYAVHPRGLNPLIAYLEAVCDRPAGHPDGGRMYIDGAFAMFRDGRSPHPCLVSNPALSIQKGSDSNLAGPARPGEINLARAPREIARRLRDEIWRWTDRDFR